MSSRSGRGTSPRRSTSLHGSSEQGIRAPGAALELPEYDGWHLTIEQRLTNVALGARLHECPRQCVCVQVLAG